MEWLIDPSIWVGLATLVALEVVLGVDNLIFIAILVGRLPPQLRERARVIGLTLALGMRLALLTGISWIMSLTRPLLTLADHDFSWRDLILIGGGLFLLVKATTEIHERLEVRLPGHASAPAVTAFWPVIAQIIVLDAVFSLDSVITAVGMVEELGVMIAAVVIAVIVMLFAARPLTDFIAARPSLIILCLGFLLMVGLVLVVDGLGVHVPKGYVYAAISFSLLIEVFNQIGERNRRRYAATIPPRRRAAHSILRLIGGLPASAMGPLAAVPVEAAAAGTAFEPLEQRMLRGVLDLAQHPVSGIMTHRAEVDWIDAEAGREAALDLLCRTPHRALPVGRGSIDELLGIVRKDEVLARLLQNEPFELEGLLREAVAVPASAKVLDVFDLFKRSPLEMAVVVDEYGGFEGLVTRTDLLEAVAGDLPDLPGEVPEVTELPGGALSIEGTLPLTDLQQHLQLESLPEGSYRTAAGMVLALLGRIPKPGDAVQWQGWTLEVDAMDGHGISRIVARPSPAQR